MGKLRVGRERGEKGRKGRRLGKGYPVGREGTAKGGKDKFRIER